MHPARKKFRSGCRRRDSDRHGPEFALDRKREVAQSRRSTESASRGSRSKTQRAPTRVPSAASTGYPA